MPTNLGCVGLFGIVVVSCVVVSTDEHLSVVFGTPPVELFGVVEDVDDAPEKHKKCNLKQMSS